MQVSEFERAVWELEGVRIVIRASAQDEVGDYDFRKAANAGSTLATFIGNRVRPRIENKEVVAIAGTGEIVHAATHMENIRAIYARE